MGGGGRREELEVGVETCCVEFHFFFLGLIFWGEGFWREKKKRKKAIGFWWGVLLPWE